MKKHGITWAPVDSTDFPIVDQVRPLVMVGWVAYRHPKRPIVMLVREGDHRFVTRGQVYSKYSNALRLVS